MTLNYYMKNSFGGLELIGKFKVESWEQNKQRTHWIFRQESGKSLWIPFETIISFCLTSTNELAIMTC